MSDPNIFDAYKPREIARLIEEAGGTTEDTDTTITEHDGGDLGTLTQAFGGRGRHHRDARKSCNKSSHPISIRR